jgi:hypothetical protein
MRPFGVFGYSTFKVGLEEVGMFDVLDSSPDLERGG